ncbi:MAG: hypothetical protein E6R04_01250 [Spirochaetes bacterium]|nr:MAG: hypothetical protein E6R04_01250 [Spirochaetota bacterium]
MFIEVEGKRYEVFVTWEVLAGVRRKVYTLVSPQKVLVTLRKPFRGQDHLLDLVEKKSNKRVSSVTLTDSRGSLEIAKVALP